jgi:hypothetical protein
MARIDGEIVIDRPVDAVFDYVADQSNEPQYNPRMLRAEKITPGPVGKGTQFRSAVASMGPTELDVYRPWLAAEFRRGLARELADAGRALSRYDAEPWAGELGLPAAMLITTSDRLVRPAKQWELAEALRAQVIEVDADHDLPLVNGNEYARLTKLAVDAAAAAAGLKAPADSPA